MQQNFSPEQHQQIRNQINKTNSKDGKTFMKHFILLFDKKTAKKIILFCDVFHLDISYFIEKTLILELFFIQEDMEEDHEIFAGYFNLEKLTENHNSMHTPKTIKNNYEICIEIHPLVARPIELYCKIIHCTPEDFIRNIIKYKIFDLFDNIKQHKFDFIGNYFDFSEIIKSIDDIYYKKL